MRSIKRAIGCVLLVLLAAGTAAAQLAIPTTLTLNSLDPAEVALGSTGPVVITATLAGWPFGGTPGATIVFWVDGASVGTVDTDSSSIATFDYDPSALARGVHTVQAFFVPDGQWASVLDPSTSNTMMLYVGTCRTTLVLNSLSPVCVAVGSSDPVVATATLTRSDTGASIAGATLRFSVDGGLAGTTATNGDGAATFNYNPSGLAWGGHLVRASFAGQTIGDTAFLASMSNRFALDVTGSGPPAIGQLGGGSPARAAVRGDYAYVAAYRCLSIFDVSDRTHPVLVGWCDTPNMATDVAVNGEIAYVACPQEDGTPPGEIAVVNIHDPTHPVVTTTWEIPYPVASLKLQDGYLYMCGFALYGAGALLVADVSSPSQPTMAATCDLGPGALVAIALSGTRAYLLDCGYGRFFAVDIANPRAPVLASSLLLAPSPSIDVGYDLACSAGYIYVDLNVGFNDPSLQGTLYILQDNRDSGLSLVGQWSEPGLKLRGVAASGTWTYVVGGSPVPNRARVWSVYTLDCSDPSSPTLNTTYTQPNHPDDMYCLTLAGSDLFLGAWEAGLDILSLADPGNPQEMGSGATAGGVRDIAVAGSYAYLADSGCGLLIADFSSPASPTVAAVCGLPGCYAEGVAVSDEHAYVACGGGGAPAFEVVDIADPHNPAVVGSCALSSEVLRPAVVVLGNYAYVGGEGELMVVDISNPTAPVEVATCSGWWLWDLVVDPIHSGFLWAAGSQIGGGSGLVDLDISDPLAPVVSQFGPTFFPPPWFHCTRAVLISARSAILSWLRVGPPASSWSGMIIPIRSARTGYAPRAMHAKCGSRGTLPMSPTLRAACA